MQEVEQAHTALSSAQYKVKELTRLFKVRINSKGFHMLDLWKEQWLLVDEFLCSESVHQTQICCCPGLSLLLSAPPETTWWTLVFTFLANQLNTRIFLLLFFLLFDLRQNTITKTTLLAVEGILKFFDAHVWNMSEDCESLTSLDGCRNHGLGLHPQLHPIYFYGIYLSYFPDFCC